MDVLGAENLGPEFQTTALDEVPRLVLEHRVLVRDVDELVVAESLGVGDVGKVGVALLAVLSNDERVVDLRVLARQSRSQGGDRRDERCSP